MKLSYIKYLTLPKRKMLSISQSIWNEYSISGDPNEIIADRLNLDINIVALVLRSYNITTDKKKLCEECNN